jgi:hypothetical protein
MNEYTRIQIGALTMAMPAMMLALETVARSAITPLMAAGILCFTFGWMITFGGMYQKPIPFFEPKPPQEPAQAPTEKVE